MSFEDVGRDINEQPQARPGEVRRTRSGPNAALIGFVVLAAIAVTFVLQNQNQVRTHFLVYTTASRVWATIGIAMAIGVALDRLASMWWRHRRRKNI